MRMLLVPGTMLLLIVAGIAAAIATDAARPTRKARTTFDATYVFVPTGASGGSSADIVMFEIAGTDATSGLGVFSRSGRPSDELPPAVRSFVDDLSSPGFAWQVDRSRLLVTRPRIYGIPVGGGSVCFVGARAFHVLDCGALENGVHVHVDPGGAGEHGRIFGIAADAVVSGRFLVGAHWHAFRIRRNAFFAQLPPGIVAPQRLVFDEANGTRHVVDVVRCSPDESNVVPLVAPLDALSC